MCPENRYHTSDFKEKFKLENCVLVKNNQSLKEIKEDSKS